ncbi:MAG: hypothetical protein EON60_12720 [Alphaproteobacteria bacterium]|nr:MAG: hypothetical protein EON60_12720 [Alphaproteobacteria bacterium]
MRHETNFPPILSSTGTFFGQESLKSETLERIASTPDKYFIRGRYVQPRSLLVRTAEGVGLKSPPHYISGCAIVHLAFGGYVEEGIDVLDMLSTQSSLAQPVIKPMLEQRLGFVPELTSAISEAYEGKGDKAVLYNIVEAIPVGATTALQAALSMYQGARHGYPRLQAHRVLINALRDYAHTAPAAPHSFF